MNETTKDQINLEKDIKKITTELQEALIENMLAGKAEVEAKQMKIKAHNRLLLAKQELYDLTSIISDANNN